MTRIRLLKDGAIGRVVLARPEKKNAHDRQAADELFAALAQLEGDATIRAIHLSAEGEDFCVGADIGGHTPGDAQPGLEDLGMTLGEESVTLLQSEMPVHVHSYVPEPAAALSMIGVGVPMLMRRRRPRIK